MWVPRLSEVVVKVATAVVPARNPEPMMALETVSKKSTRPVGVPLGELTVAARVTVCAGRAGLGLAVMVVLVANLTRLRTSGVEVLAAKLVLPL